MATPTILTVAAFNFEDGGWNRDTDSYDRFGLLAEVIAQVPDIDVLLLQEARNFDWDGQHRLFALEDQLHDACGGLLRGFMTRSERNLLHEAAFLRYPRLRPKRHYRREDGGTAHTQVGLVRASVEGLEPVLHLRSVQWAHWNGDARLDEALKLTGHADPAEACILGGDFNSLWPDAHNPSGHTEFEPDWLARPAHKRSHKTLPPGLRDPDGALASDRRALTVLAEAGFASAGSLAGDMTVTVNREIDDGQGARIDHILLSPLLQPCYVPGSYRVWTNDLGDRASDHRMVSLQLDLSRAVPAGARR